MFEGESKLGWCWFCDLTCQFAYNGIRGNWCCVRCGRELAHWSQKTGEDKQQEDKDGLKEKGVLKSYQRRYPRFIVELPFDYSRMDREEEYGGIATNASEGGLLVYLSELIPKGVILKIVILSVKGSECNTIKSMAKVVWGDLAAEVTRGKYRYGLKFESFNRESLNTFNILLKEVGKTQAG